jgi:hypothetical protein
MMCSSSQAQLLSDFCRELSGIPKTYCRIKQLDCGRVEANRLSALFVQPGFPVSFMAGFLSCKVYHILSFISELNQIAACPVFAQGYSGNTCCIL